MIEVGDRWTIRRDALNWILIHHPRGRKIKTTKSGGTDIPGQRTYHGTLGPAFKKILEDSLADAPDIESMAKQLQQARQEVAQAAQSIHAAIGSAPPEIVASQGLRP